MSAHIMTGQLLVPASSSASFLRPRVFACFLLAVIAICAHSVLRELKNCLAKAITPKVKLQGKAMNSGHAK